MQLMPSTARQFAVRDAFDPRQNIEAGARLLRQLIERYPGNLANALAAYNAGTVPVDQHGGVPPYAETQNYVQQILGWLTNQPATEQ
jgi:soluble lytic murein transglycosylase-like protein